MADAGTHVFRVSLNPKLYREFEIPSERKLDALAKAIVAQFGFDFDHAFGFYSKLTEFVLDSPVAYELFADTGDDSEAGSVKRTRIADAATCPSCAFACRRSKRPSCGSPTSTTRRKPAIRPCVGCPSRSRSSDSCRVNH